MAEAVPLLDVPLNLADILILTKNQLLMGYKIALGAGKSGRARDVIGEVVGVVGGGFLFRQAARSLIGLIPMAGIIPKVAIAYTGTWAIGRAVVVWATQGRLVSHATLHRHDDFIRLRDVRVELRPGRRRQAVAMAEHLPQLLAHVGRKWRQHTNERFDGFANDLRLGPAEGNHDDELGARDHGQGQGEPARRRLGRVLDHGHRAVAQREHGMAREERADVAVGADAEEHEVEARRGSGDLAELFLVVRGRLREVRLLRLHAMDEALGARRRQPQRPRPRVVRIRVVVRRHRAFVAPEEVDPGPVQRDAGEARKNDVATDPPGSATVKRLRAATA